MTIGKFRLHKEWKSVEGRKPDELMEVSASLGLTIGGLRLVEIPNRPGYVYARIRDQLSEVVNVYNDQVSPIYDLPVIIVRHRTDMNRWRVKGRDLGRYSGWGSTAYLPNHHDQHEFNPIAPGGDIVWVYAQQFMPLAAVPSGSSGAMSLIVKDFTYYRNSIWNYFPDTNTSSFVSYKPSGTSAVMVLLYLDDTDNLSYVRGSEFAITTGTANIIPNIPDQPSDCFVPIAGIYLLSGTSSLVWDNIYEARPFFTASVTGSAGGTSADIKAKVSVDDTTTNYLENKIVAGVGVAITTLSPGGNETLRIAVTNTGSSGGVTDHGALTGLLDNDHTQYILTGTATDELIKISPNDNTSDYLHEKLLAGTNVTIIEVSDGDYEQLQINCTVTGSLGSTDERIKISSNDTTAEYLETKIIAGNGVLISVLYEGINEQLSIAVTNTGTSGSGGHTIQNEGTPLTARTNLNFIGAVVNATDDAGNDRTNVTITSGTGSSGVLLYTKWDADAPPASPSVYDDEFDDSSLDGMWTEYDLDSTQTITENDYGLLLKQASPPGSTNVTGIYQAIADGGTGSYSITVKAGLSTILSSTNRWGIGLWTDPTNHATKFQTLEIMQQDNNLTVAIIDYDTHTAQSGVYDSNALSMIAHNPLYLRVRHIDADHTLFDVSSDGKNWLQICDWNITPVYMGLIINGEAAGQAITGLFDFFRFVASNVGLDTPCAGQRINLYS